MSSWMLDMAGFGFEYLKNHPGARYALPIIGGTFRDFDQFGDYMQMQSDYEKNTGRRILYPSVRAYSSSAYTSLGHVADDVLGAVGRTVKSII